MNSFMRRTLSADQMHSFLKDKQAWENAIAMYNGPDPLDHWYNYVCWYDNNVHGDPENKFRETLERCLTLFEHNEYYKQDNRMVKLWVKYIDMQPNPLNFYQILYQRGIGRQCSSFYINWAQYYISANAFKEAESVYNLGFQAKAQPYIDLQSAHSKFLYSLSQRMVYDEKQELEQRQQMSASVHLHEQQKVQEVEDQTQQQVNVQAHVQMQPQLQHVPQHQHIAPASYHIHQTPQPQLQPEAQQQPQPEFHQSVQQHQFVEVQSSEATAISTPWNYIYNEQAQPTAVEEVDGSTTQLAQSSSTPVTVAETQTVIVNETLIQSVKLPAHFATYCRNNYEVWKPALFLEEPADPNRRCQYAKNLVYPGNDIEFSPEEIRARKWEKHLLELNEQKQQHQAISSQEEIATISPPTTAADQNEVKQPIDKLSPSESPVASIPANIENDTVPVTPVTTLSDDIEDQIEASTIRFSTHSAQGVTKNKTIKIKFKKENRTNNDSHNGQHNYSYSIDTNYQQSEVGSPIVHNAEKPRSSASSSASNGGFHPYSCQTSTPKIKRSKKLKIVNKFHLAACTNSNSSDYVGVATTAAANTNNSSNHNYDDAKLLLTFSRDRDASIANVGDRNQSMQSQAATMTTTTPAAPAIPSSFNCNNENANFSFNENTYLDNSNCSVSSAVGRLNFRDTPLRCNDNDISTYAESSFFASQDNREMKESRLKKALETLEKHLAKVAIDPFNSELCRAFLTKLNFPSDQANNLYKVVENPLPKLANTRQVTLADVRFNIEKEVGRGSYGSVYKATDASTGVVVALKYQKPPNIWEIYICDEVAKRIKSPTVLPGIMDVSSAVIAPNASIIATEFSPFGSLLDINNKIRQATKKVMHESLVMHFSSQILNIVHYLHASKIIHADIKPDNFLLMRVPNSDLHYPSLRLIDFGCAIDMTLFPERTQFRKVIQTDGFTCIQMQEGRPWSYETDLFCIAGTVHVMLFGEYMQLTKKFDTWDIKQKLPRYLKKHVWTKFFSELLNVKNQDSLPDLTEMKMLFDEEAMKMDSELQNQIRTLSNLLHRR